MKYVAIILMTVLMANLSSCELESTISELKNAISDIEEIISQKDDNPSSENSFAGTISGNQEFEGDVIIKEFGTSDDGVISVIIPDDKSENTEEELPEKEEPTGSASVEEALYYEKPITHYTISDNGQIVVDESKNDGSKHVISVPKITANSAVAKKINDEMLENVKSMHEALLNNTEGTNLYGASYVFVEKNNTIAIMQDFYSAEQLIGGGNFYRFYYYDCETEKQLNFDEYLLKVGYTKDSLKAELKNVKCTYGYALSSDDFDNVTNALLGENEKYLVVFYPDAVEPDPSEAVYIFE